MQNDRYSVYELTVSFKYKKDRVDRGDVRKIAGVIRCPFKVGKHSEHSISLVILSEGGASKLMDRLRSGLSDIGSVENFWLQTVGPDAIGQHGDMDPFTTYVKEMWAEASKRNKAKHFKQPRPSDVFVKHGIKEFDRKAAIKMGLRGPWKRKPPSNPNRP